MSIVLAALDDNPTSTAVLAVARRLAPILGASVQGIHVVTGIGPVPPWLADVDVPVRVAHGDVVDQLVAAGTPDEVVAMTIGARGRPGNGHGHPLGSTAVGVATRLAKPVAVVPPHTDPNAALHRVLVPLEGSIPTSIASRSLIQLAPDAGLDVVALHVLEPEMLPLFTDQPQHEHVAWAREFLHRYCHWGIGVVRLVTRVGLSSELVPAAAREARVDLIVLGWSQELAKGHAPVVRAVLENVSVPVVLVPTAPG
jgi:nucleotide-binding universal stress UspA family protein